MAFAWLLFVAAGDLRLLTFNVAGLPDIVSQATPSRDMARIGALLRDYDVALVQEDFWYHAELISRDRHVYRSRPFTDTPSYAKIGDGLNQLSRFPFAELQRTEWSTCSGRLSCANDCMASKGYTFSVLTLPDITIHLYNLHLDAGECAPDFATRAAQLKQLADAINARSKGMPVIVAGDTNLDVAYAPDRLNLDAFLASTGLRDVCRALSCGRELLDRVLIRGAIEPLSWSTPAAFSGLSDHEAVAVSLRYGGPPLLSAY